MAISNRLATCYTWTGKRIHARPDNATSCLCREPVHLGKPVPTESILAVDCINCLRAIEVNYYVNEELHHA